MTHFCTVYQSALVGPAEAEVAESTTDCDRQTQVHVVSHEDQHQTQTAPQLYKVQDRLNEMTTLTYLMTAPATAIAISHERDEYIIDFNQCIYYSIRITTWRYNYNDIIFFLMPLVVKIPRAKSLF